MKLHRLAGALAAALMLVALPVRATEQSSYVAPVAGPMSMASFVSSSLNPALRALASCSWGPTAPANGPGAAALPYQCWANTTANPIVLSFFDGTSWVVLGKLNNSSHAWTPSYQGTDLGTASVAATGTSGHAVPFLDGSNVFGANTTVSNGAGTIIFTVANTTASGNAYAALQNATREWLVGANGDGACGPGGTTVFAIYDLTATACRLFADAAGGWVFSNATGGSKGAGTINLPTIYENGATIDSMLALKAALASPIFTGTPAAPTAAVDTNTTQVSTTGFVIGQAASATPLIDGTAAPGTSTRFARADHVHPTDSTRAPLASPALTGTPTVPTASPGTNSTQAASTAYADAIAALKVNLTRNVSTGCGLAGGGDLSADRTIKLSLLINAQVGTSYTVVDGDCGKLVTLKNAAAVAVSLPQANGSTFVSGWSVDFQNQGAGTVTVTPTTSTINGGASLALTQNQGMHCQSDGSNYSCVLGVGAGGGAGTVTQVNTGNGLSGGPITASGTVSNTQTRQLTRITSSGNFTTPANITTSTNFWITLVGGGNTGGGSGGSTVGGGGGAGGAASFLVNGLSPSTSYAVTIGANTGGTTSIVIGATTYSVTGGSIGAGSATTNVTAAQGGASASITALPYKFYYQSVSQGQFVTGASVYIGCPGGSIPFGGGGQAGMTGSGSGLAATGFGAGGGGGVGAGGGGAGSPGLFLAEWNS